MRHLQRQGAGSRQAGPHPPVDECRGRRRVRRGRVSRLDIVVRYGKAGFGPLFLWLFPMQEAKVAATRARRFVCGLRPFIGAVSPGTEDRESSVTSPRHTARFAAPLPRAGEGGAPRRVGVRLFTVLVSVIATALAEHGRTAWG